MFFLALLVVCGTGAAKERPDSHTAHIEPKAMSKGGWTGWKATPVANRFFRFVPAALIVYGLQWTIVILCCKRVVASVHVMSSHLKCKVWKLQCEANAADMKAVHQNHANPMHDTMLRILKLDLIVRWHDCLRSARGSCQKISEMSWNDSKTKRLDILLSWI